MHITASVFVNDDEAGLHHDFGVWLEGLAPFNPDPAHYHHNRTGEDNADAHLKRQVMGREVVVAITKEKFDFGLWEQIFYGEFDGHRLKRGLVQRSSGSRLLRWTPQRDAGCCLEKITANNQRREREHLLRRLPPHLADVLVSSPCIYSTEIDPVLQAFSSPLIGPVSVRRAFCLRTTSTQRLLRTTSCSPCSLVSVFPGLQARHSCS